MSGVQGNDASRRSLSNSTDVMDLTARSTVAAYITKDGSEIRELLNSANSPLLNQSLAEATVKPGASTLRHYHAVTEEIYHILDGHGLMHLDGENAKVGPGDSVAIPPGAHHCIMNTGTEPLVFLCCCAPAYSHDDTFLCEE